MLGAETSVITKPFGTQGSVRSTGRSTGCFDPPLQTYPLRALGALEATDATLTASCKACFPSSLKLSFLPTVRCYLPFFQLSYFPTFLRTLLLGRARGRPGDPGTRLPNTLAVLASFRRPLGQFCDFFEPSGGHPKMVIFRHRTKTSKIKG